MPKSHVQRTHKDLEIDICGEEPTQTEFCLVEGDRVVLILQNNKRLRGEGGVSAQFIAQAIAVFTHNNNLRQCVLD